MKRQTFVISAIILTLGGFFAKAIGAIYKIPLTNILGSSGMGVYYLIFPIYSLVITLCSSGLSVALTCEVAKCRKIRHKYNEQKLLRVALLISFFVSLVFSVLVIIFAKMLAEMQGNVNAYTGYIAIAPSIILSSLIATLRGYFQGIENMIPTTISLIIEQIIKLGLGLVLAHRLCIYGIEYAVLGAVLGVTISEVVALIIIVINFVTYKGQLYYNYRNLSFKRRKKLQISNSLKSSSPCKIATAKSKSKTYICNSKMQRYSTRVALQKLLKLALPCTFSSVLIPISSMLDSFMIINLLTQSGYSLVVSTSLYGLWGGVIQSLISLPTIVISAVTTSLVPSLSGLVVKNDTNEIRKKIALFIKLTWVIAMGIFILFYVFAGDILTFLYGRGLNDGVLSELEIATNMLRISSLSIIYYAFLQTFTSILQTIGKSKTPFFALLVGIVLRTGLVWGLTLIPNINVYGVVVANIIYLSVTDIILAVVIVKRVDLRLDIKALINPLIVGFVVLAFGSVTHMALKKYLGYIVSTLIIGVVVACVYVLCIYFGRVFSESELRFFRRKKLSPKLKSKSLVKPD